MIRIKNEQSFKERQEPVTRKKLFDWKRRVFPDIFSQYRNFLNVLITQNASNHTILESFSSLNF